MNSLRIITPLLILIPLLTIDRVQSINCCCFGKSNKNKDPEDAYRASPEGATGATSTDEGSGEGQKEGGADSVTKASGASGGTGDASTTNDDSSKPIKNPEKETEGDSGLWSPSELVSDQGIGDYCPGDCSLCNPESKAKENGEGNAGTSTPDSKDEKESP